MVIKIAWIIVALFWSIIHVFDNENQFEYVHFILGHLQTFVHLMFNILLACILIWLFNHLTSSKVCIDGHAKAILYILGIMMILSSLKNFYKDYIGISSTKRTKYWEVVDEIFG
jgi:hypothetical protein